MMKTLFLIYVLSKEDCIPDQWYPLYKFYGTLPLIRVEDDYSDCGPMLPIAPVYQPVKLI